MISIEDILLMAHNRGIKDAVMKAVLNYNDHELTNRYDKAYHQILKEKMENGTIEKHVLESSMLASATYNYNEETLLIEFNNGAEYCYTGITSDEFRDFLKAESKGQHFTKNIRNKPFTKVNADQPN
jgi:hypothetical protein